LFENTGLADRETAEDANFECRHCVQDRQFKELVDRIKAVEDRTRELEVRVGSIALKTIQSDLSLGRKVESDVVESFLGRVEACEAAQSILTVKMSEVEARVLSLDTVVYPPLNGVSSTAMTAVSGANPPLNRVSSTAKNAVSSGSKVTFSDKYKQKGSKTAVLIGDSMCRGVGSKLHEKIRCSHPSPTVVLGSRA